MRSILAITILLGACAPSVPSWSGGSTTPKQRGDLAVGTAARVPLGNLRQPIPARLFLDAATGAGLVPVAMVRYGTRAHEDIGLMVAGPAVQLSYRREFAVTEGTTRSTFLIGIKPFLGALPTEDTTGVRFGLDVPLLYGVDFGGLYDFWIGPHVGFEHARGSFTLPGAAGAAELADLTVFRAGLVLGLAAGFRRAHGFIELDIGYEQWFGQHGGDDLGRGGFVLTPSFGIRVRL